MTDSAKFPYPTIFLERSAHQMADKFCQAQVDLEKAERIYLNTLAVCAVKTYLEEIGFETDLLAGDSWNGLTQTCLNVADLVVKHYGKLECRPVLPYEDTLSIPFEVWENRLAFLAVQLNAELDEATLLGFTDKIAAAEIALNQLRPIADLPIFLDSHFKVSVAKQITRLNLWLRHQIDPVWQTLNDLWSAPTSKLAFSFRGNSYAKAVLQADADEMIVGGKKIDLELQQGTEQIALLVGLQPEVLPEVKVSIQICPLEEDASLPQDLRMTLLDADGVETMNSSAGHESLEFQFRAELGDRFSLQVTCREFSIVEEFTL